MSGNLTVGNPAECDEHALHCDQLGEGAPTIEARQALFHLAESWRRLAAELENAQVFLSVTSPSDTGQPKFAVGVRGDLIIVMEPATLFYAIFSKSPNQPQPVLERRRPTQDRALVAGARKAANAKARELGWIAASGGLT